MSGDAGCAVSDLGVEPGIGKEAPGEGEESFQMQQFRRELAANGIPVHMLSEKDLSFLFGRYCMNPEDFMRDPEAFFDMFRECGGARDAAEYSLEERGLDAHGHPLHMHNLERAHEQVHDLAAVPVAVEFMPEMDEVAPPEEEDLFPMMGETGGCHAVSDSGGNAQSIAALVRQIGCACPSMAGVNFQDTDTGQIFQGVDGTHGKNWLKAVIEAAEKSSGQPQQGKTGQLAPSH